MRQLAILAVTAAVVAIAVLRSQGPTAPAGDLQIEVNDRNPWTHLRLNNTPDVFRFLVLSDRTGGHRPGIFSRAIEQVNLLQPEFVLCVGDLIEGGTTRPDRLTGEWKEFQGFVAKLQMPFFYLPGNHDLSNGFQDGAWQEKF